MIYVKKLIILLIQFKFGHILFKIEQFWPLGEISIFSNGGHLGWRAQLSNTILKGGHARTIPTKFGLNWLWFLSRRLKCEKFTRRRRHTTDKHDGKSSHGLWPGELKIIIYQFTLLKINNQANLVFVSSHQYDQVRGGGGDSVYQ